MLRAVIRFCVLVFALLSAAAWAQNARIVLRWKDVPGASAYEVQIAKDPAFVEVVLQTRTTTAGYRWEQLPTTTHWWRVRSFDAEARPSEWSQPRTIAVDSAVPTPLKPADGAAIACGATAVFELEASSLIKEYQVELGTSADFSSFRTLRSPKPLFEVPSMSAGTYWWRTRAIDIKDRTSGPGPVRSLNVRVGAPKLKPAGDVPLGTPQVQLAWTEVGCAKSYLVEATQDGRDKISFPVNGLSMAFKAGQAGEYRWRVASVDERGVPGEFSPESLFRVKLGTPAKLSETVALRADLTWGPVTGATGYKVEVFRPAPKGLEPVASATVASATFKTPELPPGPYQWRVTARDALGHVSAPSEPRNFVRPAGEPLAGMVQWISPSSDVVVAPGAELELEWSELAGRKDFELEFDGVVQRLMLPQFRTPPLTEGVHVARVRAVGDGYRLSEWSPSLELYAGIPPVARAEVAMVGEAVTVRLLDAKGRVVNQAAPKFTVRDGTLGTPSFSDGQWQATWSPPASGTDVLTIEEREFKSEQPITSPADPFFTLAARAGGIFNGGAVASPSVELGFGVRLPVLRRRVGLELRAGAYRAARTVDIGGLSLSGEAWQLPLSLVVGWHQNLGAFQLRGSVGPALQLAWLNVAGDAGFALAPGFEAVAGLSRRIGPGRLELELSFLYGRIETDLARLNAGGLGVRVGYAVDF